MKLRTTKLVKVIIVSGACLTLFAYAFVKLVQSLSVMHQGSKRDMNHVDNQYDPEQDDVVGVEEELDIDLEAGNR
jgi:hypothetical protein